MKNILYLVCAAFLLTSCSGPTMDASSSGGSDGKGGSMARFAIKGDVLYTVSLDSLKVFNIEDIANPKYSVQRNMKVGFDIETIFLRDDLMFLGARSGLRVYDISEPRFPRFLSMVSHLRSCDPVVAQGDYAYVTLNTNAFSCGFVPNNTLLVYDVIDPTKPVLKNTISMNSPMGLGIDGAKLFVCDRGVKVFDITDPINIRQIDDLVDIEEVDIRAAYDVIPVDGLLIVVAKEGLYQFDYTGSRMKFVSKIQVSGM